MTTLTRPVGRSSSRAFGPSDRQFDRLVLRYAVLLRVGGLVAATAAAFLGMVPLVQPQWVVGAVLLLAVWTAVFVTRAARGWPPAGYVIVDAAVTLSICAAQERVSPARSLADGSSWVMALVSTSVFIAALLLRPVGGLAVAAAAGLTWFVVAEAPALGLVFLVQGGLAAVLVGQMRRGGRSADEAFRARAAADREAQVEQARRTDEREQLRRLHDTVLTTLSMVGAGALDGRSAVLAERAAADLVALEALRRSPELDGDGGPVSLLAHLDDVVRTMAGQVDVTLALSAAIVPAPVARALADSVAEALRNVAQHAGCARASVSGGRDGSGVGIDVRDAGRGFEPAGVPPSRRGLRESVVGRMVAVGGSAVVESAPGCGTRVVLRWPGG
ncbi:MAG: sensor histidine kinase [Mycobacteriales bacterium]